MKKSVHSGSRIVNLRDLGGYVGRDGQRVRMGLLFRSGDLNLSVEVLARVLVPLGVSLVFDLRSTDEVEARPYVLPEGVRYSHRPILASLANGMEGLNPGSFDGTLSLSPEEQRTLAAFMHRAYDAMGENPEVFGSIIKEIVVNAGRPLLFHCAAGKDRTGILATMILLALGVSLEDIKEHYLLSNEYRREVVEEESRAIADTVGDPVLAGIIRDMMLAREEYLRVTLNHVGSYPSFDDYARGKMGLTRAELEELRRLYLE